MQRPSLRHDSKILVIRINCADTHFFAYLTSAINQLLYSEENGLIPVINFGEWSEEGTSAYIDSKRVDNLWDYFFQPVAGYTYAEIQSLIADPDHPISEKNLVRLENDQLAYLQSGDPESVYNYPHGYFADLNQDVVLWYSKQRAKAQTIVEKYIQINRDTRREIDEFVATNFNAQNVLGVHIRGTDKARETQRLSKILTLQKYFRHIDQYINKHSHCKIFVATDQHQFLQAMKERYPERVICYSRVLSDSSLNPIQVDDGKQYLKGKEVLFDSILLSKCSYLLKCCSAVGEYAHYFNPHLKSTDLDERYGKTNVPEKLYQLIVQEHYAYLTTALRNFKNTEISGVNSLFFLLTGQPLLRRIFDFIASKQFSRSRVLRTVFFTKQYISLWRHKEEIPLQQVKQFARHAAQRIGSGYYTFKDAKDKKYLEIRCDGDPQAGFFAQFAYVLHQIRFAETHKLIPIVNFDQNYNYFGRGQIENVWESYFLPVTNIPSSALNELDAKAITFLRPQQQRQLFLGDGDQPPEEFNEDTKAWWQRQRAMGARLTKEYIRVRPEISKKVDAFYNTHLAGSKVLGLHLRGTDKSIRFDGRPQPGPAKFTRIIPPSEYVPFIDLFLAQNPEGKLFVASDQKQFISELSERYGAKLVHTSALRSETSENVYSRSDQGFERGIEVLTDMLLLSKSDFLLKCLSNVGEVAVYFNPKMKVINMFYNHNPDDFHHYFQ